MKTLFCKTNFIVLLFAIFSVVPTFATNYYVDGVNGNNSNTGLSEISALASIQNAADLTNPGDVVFIKNGTYSDVTYNSAYHYTVLTVTRSGSANGGYITYKNFPGHKPKLSAVNCVWGCVEIYASYIKFDGIELVGTNADITYDYAKSVFDEYVAGGRDWNKIGKVNINGLVVKGVDHVYVSNCIVRDFSGGGMAIERDDYVYIENNIVYNNCWYMMYAGSGISLFHSRDIDTNTTDYKNFIRGNTVYNNECLIPWASGNQPYKLSDGNGIIIDNNTNSQIKNPSVPPYNGRTLIENNISFNNGGGGVHGYTCANVDIINNTAYNNGSTLGYADIDAQSCTNSRIINNIMYGRTGGNCNGNDANVIYDYNIYFNGSVKKSGSHDKTIDPKFVQLPTITSGKADASIANFRLQSTSPAINNGSNIAGQFSANDILGVARPVGFSTDMGAYEYPTVITVPEMNVKQGTTDIPDNTGSFNFGQVAPTLPKIVTFTIQNIGNQTLNLTGTPKVVVTGTGFTLETDAPATVSAGGTATFQVKLAPTTLGVYSGTISIANDDADENPYNFAIRSSIENGFKDLYKLETAPTIDGNASDWGSNWTPISKIKAGNTTSDCTAKFQIGYTNDKMYVIVEVTDATPNNDASMATYLRDCVELFFKLDTTTIASGVNGKTQYRLQRNESLLESSNVAVVAKSVSTTTGYIQEWELPWSGIATRENYPNFSGISAIQVIRFEIQVADNSDGTAKRSEQLYWNAATDTQYGSMKDLGFLRLKGSNTGISNIVSNQSVLFPNPVYDVLTVKMESLKSVSVYSISGNELLNINSDDNSIKIDMSGFKGGMYFLISTDNNGFVSTQKIIKL